MKAREPVPPRSTAPSGCGAVVFALIAPLVLDSFWIGTLMTQMLLLGIVAASMIFLQAYGGMLSLAQVALFGIAGFVVGNATTNGNTKGLNLGWNPWWGVVLGLVDRRRLRARLRRHREPELRDLLPDDHAHLRRDREPLLRPGDRPLGIRRHQRDPDAAPDRKPGLPSEPPLLRRARLRARRLRGAALRHAHAVRADAPGRARRPGADGLARVQRRCCTGRSPSRSPA